MRSTNFMTQMTNRNKAPFLLACWALYGTLLLLGAALAIPFSANFGYDTMVKDMPLPDLFIALFSVASLFILLPLLIHKTLYVFGMFTNQQQANKALNHLLLVMLAVGLLARILMLFTQPLMEDDYQRYLWDGALVANGYNPYQWSPQSIIDGLSGETGLDRLRAQSGELLGRVNHPSLRTIYPPVAQFAFALSYWLDPFSLTAWRLVSVACELVSLALLLVLLRLLNRPFLWASLYWLNPLVIKELVNAGHMEVLLVPLLLGALWAAIRHKPVFTALLLALAVGVKIWPALLLPLYLRRWLTTPKKLIMPLLLFIGLVAFMATPVLIAGLDQGSGFVAYAQTWKTNSALFPTLEAGAYILLGAFMDGEQLDKYAPLFTRVMIALSLGLLAIFIAWQAPDNANDLTSKTLIVTAVLFFLSPAQMPWYALWFLPFMVFTPLYSLALLTPLLQLYYLYFYFAIRGETDFFTNTIVWLIWLPVWTVLAFELIKTRSRNQIGRRL